MGSEDKIERYPSGRPVDYTGSEGWLSRIVSGTLGAATVGFAVGICYGTVRGRAIPLYTKLICTNFTISGAVFYTMKEIAREMLVSQPEDLANPVLGGLASGILLARLRAGDVTPLTLGALFAGVGTAMQFGENKWKDYRLRRFVGNLPDEAFPEDFLRMREERAAKAQQKEEEEGWEWPEWLPVRKLTLEEAKKYNEEQERKKLETLERMRRGDYQRR